MKTALYMEDGVLQLVITPENGFEKKSLANFYDKPLNAKIMGGAFYACQGGWIRHKKIYEFGRHTDYGPREDQSLIIRVDGESEGA